MEPFAPLMGFAKWLNEPVKEKRKENKMNIVPMIYIVVGIECGILGYLEAYENESEAEGRLALLGIKLELSYDEYKQVWHDNDWDIFIEEISLD